MAAKKQQQKKTSTTFVDKALARKRSQAAKKAWETRRLLDKVEAKLQKKSTKK